MFIKTVYAVPSLPFRVPLHTVLIDNDDSFTWNLAHLIEVAGSACTVVSHRTTTIEDVQRMGPTHIVLSPGPGSPVFATTSLNIIRSILKRELDTPLLGVCLGHQCIATIAGGQEFVCHAPTPVHGKTSSIEHTGTSIFRGVRNPLTAARYHSLIVKECPTECSMLAWTKDESETLIMGIQHRSLPLFGIQFHPESYLTDDGGIMMKNFLSITL